MQAKPHRTFDHRALAAILRLSSRCSLVKRNLESSGSAMLVVLVFAVSGWLPSHPL